MSELKCCRLCPAFSTCSHKGECCPECPYFDPEESICLAPEIEKARARAPKKTNTQQDISEDVDPETFLFEDDEEEEDDFDSDDELDSFDDELDEDDFDW